MDPAEMRDRVEAARVGRLATLGSGRRPHLVPICFALDGDALYSAVDEKPKRSKRLKRLDNIRMHPEVTVLVDHYEDDWSGLWWVRLDGRAEVLKEGPERAHALELLRAKYEQYRSDPPTGAVIVVHVERWRAWTAAASR
jgi:PPOX class probable F420-dependent enzyme